MSYTNINKSSLHFNTKLWTGTSDATTAVTGVGFQPDFVWIKNRDVGDDHGAFDAVRGTTKVLFPNAQNAEGTNAESIQSFDTDGFTTGNHRGTGGDNGNKMVAWNWKANGSGSSNSDGNVTATVSANTTAGFSIVSWTSNGQEQSIGHGLGVTPDMIIMKTRNTGDGWIVGHKDNGWANYQVLWGNNAKISDDRMFSPSGGSDPTNSVWWTNSTAWVTGGTTECIAYCFAEKRGFSKFGSYVGNGNADGAFIYTGFKPAFVMMKQTDTTGNWALSDNKRHNTGGGNFVSHTLAANLYQDESYFGSGAGNKQDFLSNGFKIKDTGGYANATNGTYIYMAFAEAPLVGSNNVPCTAR